MTVMAPIVPQSAEGEFRASGTDLSERRRSGVSRGPLIDIVPTSAMTEIAWDAAGAARIGASTTIATIAADARFAAAYPGVAAAAGGLATPQIRHLATLGGNLAQRSRCWYYRNPVIACLKKGGSDCPAREGNHLYGVVFDLGPCVAPHPSTMAAALMAYEAKVTTNQRQGLSIEQLLGDGSNGAADHALKAGEMIEAVQLAPPLAGEHAAYKRAISRAYAEWPLVEVVARVVVVRGAFRFLRLTAGGVAPVPIRLHAAEAAAQGALVASATIAAAARAAKQGAKSLAMTGYKLDLLSGLVQDLLEQCTV
jgi:xanthine dehydrogenase YagS FAD-binding subunit